MKNFVQPGDVLPLTAPYALATAGLGFLVGSIFAVALSAAENGAAVEGAVSGVFDLAKATGTAWTVGVRIYWDDTAKNCTTNAAAGANKLIGVAVAAAASGDTVGRVKLTAAFTL